MASNKNQHYVPQCYLREFATDSTSAAINLYNLDREKFIINASIKHQCSKNYFYGNNLLLEKAMQPIESNYSKVLKENKAPRSKQRGINTALQAAGFQPAFAPRGGELNPERLKMKIIS